MQMTTFRPFLFSAFARFLVLLAPPKHFTEVLDYRLRALHLLLHNGRRRFREESGK